MARFAESGDYSLALEVHRSILETYRDEFAKYASGADLEKIRRIFEQLPMNIGQKVRYNRFHPDWRSVDIRRCLELLTRAGFCMQVTHCDGNNVPLAAEEDPTVAKLHHLDVGLAGTATGRGMIPYEEFHSGRFVDEGPMGEQFVAQHLFFAGPKGQRPALHYWLRSGQSQNAEVDFLVQQGTQVLPIEVKSGATGSLRSLHQFMRRHSGKLAVRLDLNPPSSQRLETVVMSPEGKVPVTYSLFNRPLYMACHLGIDGIALSPQ